MRSLLPSLLLLFAAGCVPTGPFVTAETADILRARQVSFMAAGGPAVGTNSGSSSTSYGGGADIRVRVGIGHNQEVGAELTALLASSPSQETLLVGRLRHKLGLGRHLALISAVAVGGDVISGSNLQDAGADTGIVASTGSLGDRLRLYGGARVGFSLPLTDFGGLPKMETLTLPLGLAIGVSERARLYTEAGLMAGLYQANGTSGIDNGRWVAGYFALGLELTSR